jgi:8-oxo-dGTP diphosphatase
MTSRTVYAIAFRDDGFLMVFHPRRNGWEMPGGSVEPGETSEIAAKREFMEEAGYEIEVLAVRDIGCCDVCACRLLDRVTDDCEMKSELFFELPEILSFDREEYKDTVPWAKSVVLNCGSTTD